jgi:hypothetical protein
MDFRQLSPFRSLSWRWDWACELVGQHRRLPNDSEPLLRDALHYLRGLQRAETHRQRVSTRNQYGALAAAHDLHTSDNVIRAEVEARLLAGERCQTITEKTCVPLEHLQVFARVFFDVSDRLHATDWLVDQVLGFGPWRPCIPTEAQIWKWLALAGGPIVVDIVIADALGRPEPKLHDRHGWAKRCRFLVEDFAAGFARTPRVVEIVKQYSGMLRHWTHIARPAAEMKTMRMQCNFLRSWAGLPPMGPTEMRETDQSNGPQDAVRERQQWQYQQGVQL